MLETGCLILATGFLATAILPNVTPTPWECFAWWVGWLTTIESGNYLRTMDSGKPKRFVQLQTTTNYSYLCGSSHPKELVSQAYELGYSAIAVTDDNSLAGVAKAHIVAKAVGIPLIIGSRIHINDGPSLLLWAKDRSGYANLSRLISRGRLRAEKGQCDLWLNDVLDFQAGLIAAVLPNGQTTKSLAAVAPRIIQAFAERTFLAADLNHSVNDQRSIERLRHVSRTTGLALTVAPNARCHTHQRKALLDVMTAVRLGTNVRRVAEEGLSQFGEDLGPNAEGYLQSLDRRQALFDWLPETYETMLSVADACQFSLDELRYDYPAELAPPGTSPVEHLRNLTWEGAAKRYPEGVPEKVRNTVNRELDLIQELNYEAYFLTVYDIVEYARSQNILCQGRGSAANSAVCYCLHVTSVNPNESDLLFERFVSKERNEPPDIDIDFEHQRREEVLQYIYQKYSRKRAGMTGVNICYSLRSSIRDVGKALDFSPDRIDALAKQVDGYHDDPDLNLRCQQVGIDPASVSGKQLVYLVNQLIGHPRHLSQHPGGMVLCHSPLDEIVPIENASMPDRSVIQWDKYDLDELGILKVDCLGLGIMTAIHKSFDLLRQHYDLDWDLASVPPDDTATYDMICEADTVGVFQIESRAQMATLPRLLPRCFYDLVIEIALIRPGPIQGQMVHPLLRRRAGIEQVTYPSPIIERILGRTHGVPIFQEQVMRMAIELADFTPGEADALRKAMGAWRRDGDLTHFEVRLVQGMTKNGLSADFARQVFNQIKGFGEYGFPESHATSFALLAYATAYLKCHYPAVYLAALLNSQPMGFYGPAQLIQDAKRHGVEVRSIDVCLSDWESTLEDHTTVRLGFRLLKGIAETQIKQIMDARSKAPFQSYEDFVNRTRLARLDLKTLAIGDCFSSFGLSRRQALWRSMPAAIDPQKQPLFAQQDLTEFEVDLPKLPLPMEVIQDYARTGLSLKGHPLTFYRKYLDELAVKCCSELADYPNQKIIQIAGIVIMRQRPGTAKGITFVTLEDETGQANLILHPKTWKLFYEVCRCSPSWLVEGKVQREGKIVHVIVQQVSDFSHILHGHKVKSRDFC